MSNRSIAVVHLADAWYQVTVEEPGTRTVHEVTVTADTLQRYAPGATPEALVTASFEFLLEQEPKEAILRRFDLPVIERYFPEYPRVIRARLPGGSVTS